MKYKTFIRSATNWQQFSSGRKQTVDVGLTIDEARRACERFNQNRTTAQTKRGTKMEFTAES